MKLASCSCGAKFDVSNYSAGAKLKCAKCKSIFTVPDDAPEEVPVPEQATAATAAARAGSGATQKTRTSTRSGTSVTRHETKTKTRTGTRGVGSRSSGSYKPASKSPTSLYLTIGSGVIALILIVVLVFVLKKHEDTPKNGNGNGDADAGITYEKIIAKVNPTDARGWLTVSDTCRQYQLSKEADEALAKACGMKPDDPEIAKRYEAVLNSKMQGIDPKVDKYDDKVFAIAEEAEKAGLKKLSEDICVFIVGDRVKIKGINPKHPGANKKLGRKLTMWGDWDDAELVDQLEQFAKTADAERKMLDGLTPWQRKAYQMKKDIEKSGMACVCVSEKPYLIAVQENAAYSAEIIAEDFRKVAEHLYKLFRKEYAEKFDITDIFEGDQAEEVLPIIVYDSKKTYVEKNPGTPEWAGGHFEPATGWIKMFKETGKPYETVFHEGTHQLVGAATKLKGGKDTNMFWFTEGIATYFEDFKRDGNGDFVIGIKSRQYLPEVQRAMRAKQHLTFDKIIGKSYMQFRIEQSQIRDPFQQNQFVGLHYAESWSIAYFLNTYDNGKYHDKFNEYFLKEISGEGTLPNFVKIFGDLATLEKEWFDFTTNLKLD
ncbi:MAG: DUF1570 domain-containing protein [Planctomycetota bacterium]